jgi:YfiH family protein
VLPAPFYDRDGQIAIDLPGAKAVFTTRSWGDVRETVPDIAQRLGVEPLLTKQVHGAKVITAVESVGEHPTALADADGIATTVRGLGPMILTADCLPIVIAGSGAVASVHAGWRGLDSGVIGNAVQELRLQTGDGSLTAAIGPGAGPCCYEVGPELHERFSGFSDANNLDLKAIARAQLEQAGVDEIHDVGLCTICSDRELLFSYRRDGAATGRQAAIAWLS